MSPSFLAAASHVACEGTLKKSHRATPSRAAHAIRQIRPGRLVREKEEEVRRGR